MIRFMSRNQLCTLLRRCRIKSTAFGLKVIGESPGTHDRHFCDPEYTTSSPQPSVSSSMPPRDVTASTTLRQSYLRARAARDNASLRTPVDVSACTKASTRTSECALRASSTLLRSTAEPHSSLTMIAVAPQRSTFSFIRPPNTPFWQTMTLSPRSKRLTKAASMPAEPGAEIGKVRGLEVLNAYWRSALISSMRRMNSGSR